MRLQRPPTIASAVGLLLATAAGAIVLSHLPAALHSLNGQADAARGENTLGGALAAAAGVELDKRFVRNALELVPRHSRYAVVLPPNQATIEKLYGVNPTTFAAAPTLMQNFMLPRRKVKTVTVGTYVLCYYCETHWHHRMRWLWDNQNGERVGVFH